MNQKPFRIVFMGTPEFAVPSLQSLLDNGEDVVAVVSQPDRPQGRGRKLLPTPVKKLAQEKGITVLQPTAIRTDEFLETISTLTPDLIVVTAYGRILPGALISLPPLGTINVHGSLLPKYRGAAPIQWALIKNETETGVTIMQMDKGIDTGDILLPAAMEIGPQDTTGTLAPKLAELGGQTLAKALNLLRDGKLPPQKQDDSRATMAPLLTKEQGEINWQHPAAMISGLIRRLDPWPTAHSRYEGSRYKLFAPRVISSHISAEPGTLLQANAEGLHIVTGDGLLIIGAIQLEGSRRMTVSDFLRGHTLSPGGQFQ